MDVCITAQEPFSCEPIGSKPFEPVQTSQKAANDASASASAPILLGAKSSSSASKPKELEFELITYDPSNDIPSASAKKTGTFRLSRTIRRQKLAAATLFLTFGGVVIPLGPKEEDWHYRNAITKTDLLQRAEGEWYLIKEMIASSSGSFKCYIVIRGEVPSNRKSSGWWLSNHS
ncbi:hypothetical protein FSOLCH5_002357 [Fusarium solani]